MLGLLLLTAVLYYPGLTGPFIFDDAPALTSNHYLKIDGREFDDWRTAIFSSKSGPLQRPIAMWSFTANSVVSGEILSFPTKLVNLLIHLLCGCLVYLFARIVLRRGSVNASEAERAQMALLAAAFWLLAPLHVSTVLYAVQRMAQLATLFSLLGLLLFARRREQWAEHGASAGDLLATSLWVLLVAYLAALSKENGLLLLWLLPVMEVTLYRGRWRGARSTWISVLGWLGVLLPLVLVVAVTLLVPELVADRYVGREFTLEERLLTQLRLLWQYVGWLVFPDINGMGFQHDDFPLSTSWLSPWTTLLSAVAWVVVVLLAWALRQRVPLLGFALLFYLVGHAMESSVWPLEMVYEHRSYLPSVGLFILISFLVYSVIVRLRMVRLRVPVFALLAVLSMLLFMRVHAWADPLRLSLINVRNHPESSRSHYFLAESWLREHQRALSEEAGASDRGEHLVAARHHYELMYQKNPRDFAAIVMLYYMDSYHFPGLQQYNDWFSILQELAHSRRLQASDLTALDALLECFAAQACQAPEAELFGLLDTLEQRYPNSVRFLLLRYRYLRVADAPLEERVALLERAQVLQPDSVKVYQYQIGELFAQGDTSGLYEAVKGWMFHDAERQNLGVIRDMFSSGGEQSQLPVEVEDK